MPADPSMLDRRILAFIQSAGRSEAFDALALDLFDYQYAGNEIYCRYCNEMQGLPTGESPEREPGRPRPRPAGIRTWRDIPAVWPVAWRMADLCCFAPAEAVATFRSSGTTSLSRSRHLFDPGSLELYRAALAGPFAETVLPTGAEARSPILVLMPSPEESPDSSLSFMMGEVISRFGLTERSGFFVRDGRLLVEAFTEAVERTSRAGQAMALASTALGWVALLDWLGQRVIGPLPAGSRIMETGGYKGRSAEWPRAELYARLARAFTVAPEAIVSEYGMCELSSQFYSKKSGVRNQASGIRDQESGVNSSFSRDPELADRRAQGSASGSTSFSRPAQGSVSGPIFRGPPWTRVLAIDPETQLPVPPGQPGLLRVIDLANRGSCIAVQTEDLVILRPDEGSGGNGRTGSLEDCRTFELLGRAPSAPPKGCSLTTEDLANGLPFREKGP